MDLSRSANCGSSPPKLRKIEKEYALGAIRCHRLTTRVSSMNWWIRFNHEGVRTQIDNLRDREKTEIEKGRRTTNCWVASDGSPSPRDPLRIHWGIIGESVGKPLGNFGDIFGIHCGNTLGDPLGQHWRNYSGCVIHWRTGFLGRDYCCCLFRRCFVYFLSVLGQAGPTNQYDKEKEKIVISKK